MEIVGTKQNKKEPQSFLKRNSNEKGNTFLLMDDCFRSDCVFGSCSTDFSFIDEFICNGHCVGMLTYVLPALELSEKYLIDLEERGDAHA